MEKARAELKAEHCPFGNIIIEEGADPSINEKKCNGCLYCITHAPEGILTTKEYVKPEPKPKPAPTPKPVVAEKTEGDNGAA
jgi:MinD superfamily P-loop ATPase